MNKAPENADDGSIRKRKARRNSVLFLPYMGLLRRFFLPAAFLLALAGPAPHSEAALTTPQIQAILSVLASFGVDSSTVENVRAILEGRPNPQLPLSGNQTSYPYLVILSPSPGTALSSGTPLDIKWQGLYANSVYVLSLSAVGSPLTILQSVSVTAYDAGCSISLSCTYTLTPAVSGTSTVLTLYDRVSGKLGTVSPLIQGGR